MTAVDYLIEQLQAPCRGIPSHIIEQAKEMEKQQLIDARDSGIYTALNRFNNELLKENHIVETNEMIEISEDEIWKKSDKYYNKTLSGNGQKGFIEGAKWYREQLKQRQ